MNYPKISIVVPTLNEENNIEACIKSVKNADYPQNLIEIIVADTGSKDQTKKIAEKFNVKILNLSTKKPSAAYGLFHGIKESSGDFIQYLAADSLLEKGWLTKAVDAFIERPDEKIGVIGGSTLEKNPSSSIFSKLLSIGLSVGNKKIGEVLYNAGTGLIKKSVILSTQFNPAMVSEDEVDFGFKVKQNGFKFIKLGEVMIIHDLGLKNNFASLIKMLRRYWRQGLGLKQLKIKHLKSQELKTYLKGLRLYRSSWLFLIFLIGIIILIPINFLLACLVFIGGLIIIFIFSSFFAKKNSIPASNSFSLSLWYLTVMWIMWSAYYFGKIQTSNDHE
jgi:glycosyltransferase involved in cell wall biosynthesis